ncbi:carboxypeptidase B1-like [Panulirus ornatus]|uniref:carboxypeptidase B1-like n=1 Tax=Panulirus ornatus TaxID=150431 RepID=UPI003A845CAF
MEDWTTRGLVVVLLALWPAWAVLATTNQTPATYAGWQVLEVGVTERTKDGRPVLDLHQLDDTHNMQILTQNRLKGVAQVALSPAVVVDLTQYLDNMGIPYTTVIDDLNRVLQADGPSLRAVPISKGAVTYNRFMKYEEIMAHVEDLPVRHPELVKLREVGRSVENRPLYLLTITSDADYTSSKKPIIFIEGGIHAREWISPAAALNVVGRLLQSPTLTREIEWRIIPLTNPDGYVYTWTHDRLWRKNRGETKQTRCPGVDLNRNFGYHWGEKGTSERPCSTIYRGPQAFSEPESRAVRDVLLEELDRTEAYLSFHSYGQLILHPWGYTSMVTRANINRLTFVANEMARAIKQAEGETYQVGSPAEILYPASGAADDWAAGVGKIPLVFTMELRDDGAAGFVLPNDLIKPAVNDAWVAVEHLGKHVITTVGVHIETRLPVFPIWPRDKNKVPLVREEGSSQGEVLVSIGGKNEEEKAVEEVVGSPPSKLDHVRVRTRQEEEELPAEPGVVGQDRTGFLTERQEARGDPTQAKVLKRAHTIQLVRGPYHVAGRGDDDDDDDDDDGSSSEDDSVECFGHVHGRRSIADSDET